MERRGLVAVLAALPALVLAVAGLFHPHSLTAESADTWFLLHLVALFVFPLVGLGLVTPLIGRRDAVSWVVRLGAFGYATAYTALDVISGIAAGYVTGRLPEGTPRPEEVWLLFRIGTPLGEVGSWSLLVATGLLVLDGVRRTGARAVVLLVLPVGAWLVHVDHIFSPVGVLGMGLVGVGTGLAVWWSDGPRQLAGAMRQPIRGDARHSG
ncbi:hypothetical protein [Nocardioides sp. GXQ0305]|uniref:hypothetical protein n=1 Tax=Nocardioides sp. GXQ0305 TaxID=3423912 RepID=UPI003D7CA9D7